MKQIKYLLILAAAITLMSCGDDFLDQKNLYEKYDIDYYKNATDVAEALAGAYSVLPSYGGATNPTLMADLMSDDCFGGGGSGDLTFHDLDLCTNSVENNYYGLWSEYYKGINRANMLIKRFNQTVFTNDDEKNQAHGEAYFLRAYFYFTLAKFFGNVPLITTPDPLNLPKATADELFAQIASDMKQAIELMPSTKYTSLTADRIGHANKWVAEGMMARVYLFYTGYYNKTEMPLAEGGSVTKDAVVKWVDDCISNSGYDLVPDFRNIWPYAYLTDQYPYATKNSLNWIGEGTENKETMFAVKYSVYGGWNDPKKVTYSNQVALYMGLRIQTDLVPWSLGWGAGPVNPELFSSFEATDVRAKGSVIDITDPDELGSGTYLWGSSQMIQETGLWNKKNTSLQKKNAKNTIVGMFLDFYPTAEANGQLWNLQDEILLRFSDVLLMGAELNADADNAKAKTYLDRVRSRVGLASVAASLENIKIERRHELAFEGVRYFDLLRWHDAEAAFDKIKDIPVKTSGVDDVYSSSYRPETGGFLPIPESEIRLSNGVLKQNPGW